MRILPSVLKELVKHVPTVLFHLVDWGELMGEIPHLTRRILNKEGHQEIFDKQKEYLESLKIILRAEELKNDQAITESWVAQRVIHLYFAQLFSPHGCFLDLRSQNFASDHPYLLWNPTGLWVKFSPKFQEGMINIYDGFYLGNEEVYRSGLMKIGIMKDEWHLEDKNELSAIFKSQFGSSIDEAVSFNLETFKNSMLKISEFLIHKKITITKDFLYLGIYLVTMYSFLEESGQKIEVKNEYLKIKELLGKS